MEMGHSTRAQDSAVTFGRVAAERLGLVPADVPGLGPRLPAPAAGRLAGPVRNTQPAAAAAAATAAAALVPTTGLLLLLLLLLGSCPRVWRVRAGKACRRRSWS